MAEESKALIRSYVEELNHRNLSVLDELVADEVAVGSLLRGDASSGMTRITREQYAQGIIERIEAFPDYRVTIIEMIAEGDQVVVYWSNRGTHRGSYMGATPSGREVTETAISIYRITKNRILEVRTMWDRADTWRQLGIEPEDFELGG